MQEIIEQLLSYLRGMWRYRWYALGMAWLICLGGWAFVWKMPDQYEASARVYVDTQSILRPLLKGLAVDVNPRSQIDLMTRTLLSRPNLEKVARMTDLDLKAEDSQAMDRLLTGLSNKITLRGGGRDNLYTIAVEDRNPQLAKNIVQSLLTIFMEDALGETRQDSNTAQRFLDRQIAEYEARLAAAENRVKEFKRENVGLMPSNGQDYYQRMQAVAADLARAKLELRQVENRRDSLQRQITGEEPSFGMGPAERRMPLNVSLPIDSRIQNLQQRLDGLLLQYTEKHPDVIAIRQTVALLKKQREEELAQWVASMANSGNGIAPDLDANPVYQQLKIALGQEEANIASLQVQVNEYERRLEELKQLVNTIPAVEAELAALNRDYQVTKKNYETLLARREQARMSEQVGQTTQDVRFRIIDPPRVPLDPSGPNRPVLMSGVLVGGLGLGLALAVLMSQIWPTFDTRRNLMAITNIPVLGSVGMIFSPATVRRERTELLAYFSFGAILLTIYAGLVALQTAGIQILGL